MNRMADQNPNPRRLYRDVEHSLVAGVCAGIADYFGLSVRALRWVVIIGCFFAGPAIVLSYLAAAFLLPRKPAGLYTDERDELFWRSVRRDPHFTFDDIRGKFRDLDRRIQGMERYVTSPRFDLDQEFRDLR
jgi:phage shock protein C